MHMPGKKILVIALMNSYPTTVAYITAIYHGMEI